MSIEDLIDDITRQNFAKAEPHFHTILQSKVDDALEAEKVKVAGHIFNGEEEEQLELDLDDEDESEEEVEETEEDEEEESDEEEEEVEEET
jgi:X-linked retinitis pigmentosa GTPase regulator